MDGWPIASGQGGTFTTSGRNLEVRRKRPDVGIVYEHVPWAEQSETRCTQVIIDQPLVRAGDGSPDPSMFAVHHGWIDNMSEYRQKKLDAVKSGVFTFAQDRVAWFQERRAHLSDYHRGAAGASPLACGPNQETL